MSCSLLASGHGITHCLRNCLRHGLTPCLRHGLRHCLTPCLRRGLTHGVRHGLTHGLRHGLTHCVRRGLTPGLRHGLTHCLTHGLTHSLRDMVCDCYRVMHCTHAKQGAKSPARMWTTTRASTPCLPGRTAWKMGRPFPSCLDQTGVSLLVCDLADRASVHSFRCDGTHIKLNYIVFVY